MDSNDEMPGLERIQPVFNPIMDEETWNRIRNFRPRSTWTGPVTSSSLASFHRPSESAGPEAMRVYINNFRGDRPPLLTVDEMNDEREQRGQARIPVSFSGLGGYTTNGLSLQEYSERMADRDSSHITIPDGISNIQTSNSEVENNILTLPNPFGITSQDDLEAFQRFRASIISGVREPLQDTVINTVETRPESHRHIRRNVNVVQNNDWSNINFDRNSLVETFPNSEKSYITLLSQLYGLPVEVPKFLILNDLKVDLIPFEKAAEMLSKNQIERFILEPILQPWAGTISMDIVPNRIITMFGKNGITYLVKAKYDQTSNQIFPPI